MNETYLAVAGRIRRELKEIDAVVERAQEIWEEANSSRDDDYHIDAVAINLHAFYAGLERIFETIAARIDQTVPEGGNWHQELLDQMNTELSRIRPPVLSDQSRKQLDRFRGFRHVVRNVYTFEFDPEQIDLLVRRLPEVAELVRRDLHAFADVLEDMTHEGNAS